LCGPTWIKRDSERRITFAIGLDECAALVQPKTFGDGDLKQSLTGDCSG